MEIYINHYHEREACSSSAFLLRKETIVACWKSCMNGTLLYTRRLIKYKKLIQKYNYKYKVKYNEVMLNSLTPHTNNTTGQNDYGVIRLHPFLLYSLGIFKRFKKLAN